MQIPAYAEKEASYPFKAVEVAPPKEKEKVLMDQFRLLLDQYGDGNEEKLRKMFETIP